MNKWSCVDGNFRINASINTLSIKIIERSPNPLIKGDVNMCSRVTA